MAVLLLTAVSAAQPASPDHVSLAALSEEDKAAFSALFDFVPDHVCLPSVSEEDAAWSRLQWELASAVKELKAVDTPAKAAFKAEEKLIVMGLIKRKKELDARYEAASKVAHRLNPSPYPCSKPELRSPDVVAACEELSAVADLVRIAEKGDCHDHPFDFDEVFVKPGSPCEDAAKKYSNSTSTARSSYEKRVEVAQAVYRYKMLPACSLWQRITLKELDRPTLRARQS